jgi:prolyl-tRNA editing enzyme YbaK/EbsC (Cys-tRNA(Pro) deacylase)/tRNA1(Val) A37 N6-methylase TrmN6
MNSVDLTCSTYSIVNRPSGRTLEIDLMSRGLMPPSFSTNILIENMRINPHETVLDLGAGTGIVGIAAHMLGASAVTLADIVDDAGQVMKINVARNALSAQDFDYLTGDLYCPLGRRRFDHIIANPPSIPAPGDSLPLPYRSGPDGRFLHDPIQSLARYYLKANGRLTIVHGSLANLDLSLANLEKLGFRLDVAGPFENPFSDFFPIDHLKALSAAGRASFIVRDGTFYENRYVITATRQAAHSSPVMRILDDAAVPFRMLPHKRIALTVALAAAERKVPEDEMVKCILLRDKAGRFVLAALPGNADLDVQQVRNCVPGLSRLSFASPEEITRVTGYTIGAVSPFSLAEPVPVVLDEAIGRLAAACRQVNISSGDPLLGLELAAQELIGLLGKRAHFGSISRSAAAQSAV